jgi:phenylacetate-coenzyme A ligase PaaK-like adenylate-forming protein
MTLRPQANIAPASTGELAWCYKVQPGIPGALDERGLRQFQLERLNETLQRARANSRFYGAHLPEHPLKTLDELAELPLMDATAWGAGMEELLCISPADVGRIVTLPTSGTSGAPKRVAFSPNDHQSIVNYLAAGMRMLAAPGEAIAVLFPCDTAGGLGALISESIELAQGRAVRHGIPKDFDSLAVCFERESVRAAVGFPQHLLAFARWCEHRGHSLDLRSLLLSADYVAASLCDAIKEIWDTEVFAHFGMTETGYGGAVECPCHNGLHVRETDLLVEIIDPVTGEPVSDGTWGELVFTTLGREALPLIRYRSGDRARILPEPCACGSPLKRLDRVAGRLDDNQAFIANVPITMPELEECLFGLKGVADFSAAYDAKSNRMELKVAIFDKQALDKDQILKELNSLLVGRSDSRSPLDNSRLDIVLEVVDDFEPFYFAKRHVKKVSTSNNNENSAIVERSANTSNKSVSP